jgi:hypothetical protein
MNCRKRTMWRSSAECYEIHEATVTYRGRTQMRERRIRFTDGLIAMFTLLKYRCFRS